MSEPEKVPYDNLSADAKGAGKPQSIEMVLDIPVTLSIEIGRTEMSIKEVLALSQGSLIELDRIAGDPVDLIVNGRMVAKGEVVVVNEKFALRLTSVNNLSSAMQEMKKKQIDSEQTKDA